MATTAGLVATTPLIGRSQSPSKADSVVEYGETESYRSRHTCSFELNGADLSRLEIWIPVATNWNEQQVSRVVINPRSEPVTAKNGPTQVARCIVKGSALKSDKPFESLVETEWTRTEVITDIQKLNQQKYRPYDEKSADYKAYIASETSVQSKEPGIVEAALRLKGEGRPWAHVAYDLYSWVLDRTDYTPTAWKGAKACLKDGNGSCGDYSALFIAACRAAGIPARINSGFWAIEKNGYHIWAEFMLPNGEWVPVDASLGDHNPQAKRRYFGYLDNNRITMSKTADVRLEPVGKVKSETDFLQDGAWFWQGRGGGAPVAKFEFSGSKVEDSGAEQGEVQE